MGRYCLHYHLKKQCTNCYLKGNAVVNSIQGAIVIHATHESTVEENVLWDSVTVGVYTEDGQEMNNTIARNVMICSDLAKCKFGNNGNTWQGESGVKEGGVFMFGMTNNVIENRVAGHEHGMWTPGGSVSGGKGTSQGKMCPQNAPFLKVQRNVFHDCQRFGTYPDNQHPRQLERDEDGFVVKNEQGKLESCSQFKVDGSDNGAVPASFIEDQFDWHNMFVGQYAVGDISYKRMFSVNNAHGMYWKRSKNFADGVSYHIEDSVFLNDPDDHVYGILHSFLPGGAYTFRMKNVTYGGTRQHGGVGVIAAPQHCGLGKEAPGTCLVHYLFEDVDFTKVRNGGTHVSFGASGGNPMAPMYIAFDDSLDGNHEVVAPQLNGFGNVNGCSASTSAEVYGKGMVCDETVQIRRLILWSSDMGDLKISGKGYNVESDDDHPTYGVNAGRIHFDNSHGTMGHSPLIRTHGYGAHVIVGEEYVIEGLNWVDDVYFVFSDPVLADANGGSREDEFVKLVLKMGNFTRTCTVSAAESRLFVAADGIASGAAHGNCTEEFWQLALDHGITTTTTTTTTTEPKTTVEPHDCDCGELKSYKSPLI